MRKNDCLKYVNRLGKGKNEAKKLLFVLKINTYPRLQSIFFSLKQKNKGATVNSPQNYNSLARVFRQKLDYLSICDNENHEWLTKTWKTRSMGRRVGLDGGGTGDRLDYGYQWWSNRHTQKSEYFNVNIGKNCDKTKPRRQWCMILGGKFETIENIDLRSVAFLGAMWYHMSVFMEPLIQFYDSTL